MGGRYDLVLSGLGRMNLSGKPPFQKQPKAKPNPAYLAAVRKLPCCICDAFGEVQLSPTTAHHPIMGRGSTRRRPDETAVPICDGHHQGTFDRTKVAVHRQPKLWREKYGLDTDYIKPTQDRLGNML